MAKPTVPQSILEQILEEMFKHLAVGESFNAQTVQQLKNLAASGGLSKSPQVAKVLKAVEEGNDETA